MTLIVVLDRHQDGLCRARVLQGGQFGNNILIGRAVRDVAMAKSLVRAQLRAVFREIEIVWQEPAA